jgi:hypothetical protein
MAEQNVPATDADGIVLGGRFAGHKLADVLQYAEGLEATMAATPPVTPPVTPKAPDPAAVLAEHAAGRVDTSTALLIQRLEADDEAQFAASVPDYEKFRPQITEMKKTLSPNQRMQKGVHYFVYSMIKAGSDPAVRAAILQTPPVAPVEPGPVDDEIVPPPSASGAETPPPVGPVTPPAPKAPKAVAPAAPPTPAARRAVEPPKRVPKLVSTEKLVRQAKAFGVELSAYLMRLEDQGVTQEEINSAEARTSRSVRRETVYDRALR